MGKGHYYNRLADTTPESNNVIQVECGKTAGSAIAKVINNQRDVVISVTCPNIGFKGDRGCGIDSWVCAELGQIGQC